MVIKTVLREQGVILSSLWLGWLLDYGEGRLRDMVYTHRVDHLICLKYILQGTGFIKNGTPMA